MVFALTQLVLNSKCIQKKSLRSVDARDLLHPRNLAINIDKKIIIQYIQWLETNDFQLFRSVVSLGSWIQATK